MNETILNLQRMPGYKSKIWDKVTEMHAHFEEQKGFDGLKAGEMARHRLQMKNKYDEIAAEKGLENIILQTSKTSALQAINLS
jgi:hypothetical protein